jgi:hypothetical protein
MAISPPIKRTGPGAGREQVGVRLVGRSISNIVAAAALVLHLTHRCGTIRKWGREDTASACYLVLAESQKFAVSC